MVQNGFTRKKVSSLTLGEKLRKLRSDMRMSLQDAAKSTKIQAKYLDHLENGAYEKLPADVYVRGFLRSYARYLNVDEAALVKLYERERNIHQNLAAEEKPGKPKTLAISSLVITPRSVILTLIFLCVAGSFYYLYREFRSFAAVPHLVILSPQSGTVIEGAELTLTGKAEKGARVSINHQPVFVGDEGEFAEKLTLPPGVSTITVSARNRFDKEKVETLSVESRPPVAEPAPIEPFAVEVSVREEAQTVVIEADGIVIFKGTLAPGVTQRAEAKERIRITTGDASRTLVRSGEAEPEPLGEEDAPAEGVTFTRDGRQSAEGTRAP